MRFILIDEVLEMAPGRSITAAGSLSPEEELFRDHFPGFPVVPGVLLTEMMGQAAGKCLVAEHPARGRPILVQIKSASFRQWVRPGQRVVVRAEIKSSRAQFATALGSAEVEGRGVASAELLFTFLPEATFSPNHRDEVLERFLGPRADETLDRGSQIGDRRSGPAL